MTVGSGACSSVHFQPVVSRPRRASGWNAPNEDVCHQTQQQRRHPRSLRHHTQRKVGPGPCWSRHGFMFTVLLGILLCTLGVDAGKPHSSHHLPRSTELLIDRRDAPAPRTLFKRDDSIAIRNAESPIQESQTPLPQPFDTNLGNNFTSSTCPAFFESFLNNVSFQNCLPLSLLLQTSNAFFTTTRSPDRLQATLDSACHVDYQQCSKVMKTLAEQIQTDAHCGADLRMKNPQVEEAYNGFVAYQPLYHAGCLKDSGGNYCFADAATNTSAPASSYVYYLPLGVPVPPGSQLACNTCLQKTMSIFATYTSDTTQPLSSIYGPAAQEVDSLCGSHFVDSGVQTASSAASSVAAPWLRLLVPLAILLCLLS